MKRVYFFNALIALLLLFSIPVFADNSIEDDNMTTVDKKSWGGACGG
tara:strand:- start:1410 stop:1550 length:141 start_codon:yes stop_codon:yes gene_type:complete